MPCGRIDYTHGQWADSRVVGETTTFANPPRRNSLCNAEGGNNGDDKLETALSLIGKYGSLADTIARARHYGTIARDALAPLPQSPWKSALLDVIDFSIQRVN